MARPIWIRTNDLRLRRAINKNQIKQKQHLKQRLTKLIKEHPPIKNTPFTIFFHLL
ncbi:hypothetical protein [Histophilus somni]|uniref:hypothetical protein n=1 Tax=Histophilus somni TaxID=731 RepID=UPI000045D5C6|nr:hypothetical protein [Histophilus somni]